MIITYFIKTSKLFIVAIFYGKDGVVPFCLTEKENSIKNTNKILALKR